MRKLNRSNKLKKFTHKMQANLLLVFCVIIVAFFVLMGRLIYLNNKDGERYAKRVLSQQIYVNKVIPYKRGDITDRNGTVLATSEKVYNLILDPKNILNKETNVKPTIAAVCKIFDVTEDEILEILETKSLSQYIILRKQITFEKYEQFKDLEKKDSNIKGVWFEDEYLRKYPYDTLASHIIGFTSKGNVGNWGVEEYYNEELNGSDGSEYGYFDSELKLERNVRAEINGNTIVTTIDAYVQEVVQRQIEEFNKEVGSENTGVIIMNPNNGEIYAMASYPEYDLNNPRSLEGFYTDKEIKAMSDEESLDALNYIWRSFVISDTFEPGSTFKPFTIAAGLEEAKLTGDETFYCDGYEEVLGAKIKCSKKTGHGVITLKEALMYSCNDALMQIAFKEGKKVFGKWQRLFGFGYKSGIDLPGESMGILYKVENLNPVELATNSFGQSFTTNMMQLASAYSSLVNGGHYYEPHVVKRIEDQRGVIVKTKESVLAKETVSEKTSRLLNDYLLATVESGTAGGAKVEGYSIGGKTGTAQTLPRGNGKYLVSFIGSVPAENPDVVIFLVVDKPNVDNQANSAIATTFASRILAEILPFLDLYPTVDSQKDEKKDLNNDTEADNKVIDETIKETENTTTENPLD